MKYLRIIAGLMLIAVSLTAPLKARACPLCTEMVAAAADDAADDRDNFPEAVNQSIYVMVSVPYLCFGVVGFFVYRGVKKNREYLARTGDKTG
jgi:amino acid permease